MARVPKSTTPKAPAKPSTRRGGLSHRTLAIAVGGAVVVAAVLIAGSLLLGGDDEPAAVPPATGSTAVVDGIPQRGTVLGSPEARVTLTQFEDFQCPFCATYTAGAFPTIVKEYVRPGDVKIEFAGLSFIGDDSEQALRAALAAGEQGAFWQFSELLYQNQGEENSGWVTDELIASIAEKLELDRSQLEVDMESEDVTHQMEDTLGEALELDVEGTPTFFVSVDGGPRQAVHPTSLTDPASFRKILDDALDGA